MGWVGWEPLQASSIRQGGIAHRKTGQGELPYRLLVGFELRWSGFSINFADNLTE